MDGAEVYGFLNPHTFTLKCEYSCSNINIVKTEDDKSENENAVKCEVKLEDTVDVDNVELNIKTEEIEIKSESNDCESFQDTTSPLELMFKNLHELKKEISSSNLDRSVQTQITSEIQMYNCERCLHAEKMKGSLKEHMLVHQSSLGVKMYDCEKCSVSTVHLPTHQHISEVTTIYIYKCGRCSYESKRKSDLKKHIRIHQDLSDVTVHRCDRCEFKTKHRGSLKRHLLTHLDVLEVTLYKCEKCLYMTKCNSNLKKHMRIHQDPSDVRMYKCEMCSFQTIYKLSLKRHCETCHDPSLVALYKCDKCWFISSYKTSLKRHLLIHKDISETTVKVQI